MRRQAHSAAVRARLASRRPLPESVASTAPPSFVDTIPVGEGTVEANEGERDGRRRRRRRGGRRDDAGLTSTFQSHWWPRGDVRGRTGGIHVADDARCCAWTSWIGESAAPRECEWPRREERTATATTDGQGPAVERSAAHRRRDAGARNPGPCATRSATRYRSLICRLMRWSNLADEAGLQWVQSDADKVRSSAAGHRRRAAAIARAARAKAHGAG